MGIEPDGRIPWLYIFTFSEKPREIHFIISSEDSLVSDMMATLLGSIKISTDAQIEEINS